MSEGMKRRILPLAALAVFGVTTSIVVGLVFNTPWGILADLPCLAMTIFVFMEAARGFPWSVWEGTSYPCDCKLVDVFPSKAWAHRVAFDLNSQGRPAFVRWSK